MIVQERAEEFKDGLTWRSFLAALYALALFTPATIWLSLVTVGAGISSAIQIATILIFVEFARYSGYPLTKQEATIIFLIASTGVASSPFLDKIYAIYFVHSPISTLFGLTNKIPTWWAPSLRSEVWELRTFFHPDWMVPILIYAATQILGTLGAFVFASFAREIFIEKERLPFPVQQVNAEMILVLSEREEKSLAILSMATVPGLIYGFILYTIPTIFQAAGYNVSLIPIPWVDLTRFIERFMPGATFGIATDVILVGLGIVLPPVVACSMLIGSVARYIFVNWLTVHYGVTMWASRYNPGMDMTKIFQESTLYLWANFVIGMSFAAAIAPLFLHPRAIADALRALGGREKYPKERVSGPQTPPKLLFLLLIAVGLSLIATYQILVPDFPILALFVWEYPLMFIMMLVTVRLLGETGIVLQMPNMQQLLTLMSGYQGIQGWFLPLDMHPGTTWTMNFKVCQLTKTDTWSLIRIYFTVFPLSIVFGLLYVTAFWSMAPIPSAQYPAPAIMWPVQAMYQSLWITRPADFFRPEYILYAFLVMLGLDASMQTFKLPLSAVGVLGGIMTPIPSIITIFIGTLVGSIISYRIGKEQYDRYKLTLAAGLMLGEGLAIIFGSAGALIERAIWARPF